MRDRGPQRAWIRHSATALSHVTREKPPHRVHYPRIADYDRRPDYRTVGHLHAYRTAVLDDDLGHLGVDKYFAAGRLDQRCDGLSDPARSADRIVRAVEVMVGDQRVDGEAALRGRESEITPLSGEHG